MVPLESFSTCSFALDNGQEVTVTASSVAVSIVSHGHGMMVSRLIRQLQACPQVTQIILTLNVPEPELETQRGDVEVILNLTPKGFGANHNSAFLRSRAQYWCVINPDVEIDINPFVYLLPPLGTSGVDLVAPAVKSPSGKYEDSIRCFPSFFSILRKVLTGFTGAYTYTNTSDNFLSEWVAGMFMLFKSDTFLAIQGFDERYFLYYEDIDICVRLWKAGFKVLACPTVSVTHDARRASHANWRHRRWHIASMLRYLVT